MLQRLSDGRILISNLDGGVSVSNNELRTIEPLHSDGDNYISANLDQNGSLWLGSRSNGINVGGRHYGNGRVDCILKDQKGRMWICGLDNGVKQVSVENKKYTERTFLHDIEGLSPRTMLLDHRGDIWLGTQKGLFVFNPDHLMADPKAYEQVMKHRVMCLYESSEQYIWVGTAGNGVFYGAGKTSSPRTFMQVTAKEGLANNIVQLISEDNKQNLCIGTENGCSFINPFKEQIHNLHFTESTLRNIFNERCVARLKDGRMAFGTFDGIVITKDVMGEDSSSAAHPLMITGMTINGTSVFDMEDQIPFKGDISQCQEITLSHQQNTLTFSFSNLSYGDEQQTIYKCKLDGYDKEWVTLTNQHVTAYKNLPPGTYLLHAKSQQIAGVDDYAERLLTIHIKPPLWATWWAYLIYVLLAFAVAYIIYRQLRHQNELRQRVAVERKVTEYKLRFFTNISHEFRTPLTLIQGAMERIESVKNIPSDMRYPVSNMKRSVDRMLRLINQLLEFRRMQNGKLALSLQKTDVVALLYDIYMDFHSMAENRRINYQFATSKKTIDLYVDRGYIDKIMYNLLSNAFRYTPKGGSITIKVGEEYGRLIIRVTDSGVGISKEKQTELFERYATGRLKADSIGIGLNLTQELVRVHHGQITYQDNPTGGSIFKVELPIDESVYQPQDFMQTDTVLSDGDDIERSGFKEDYREMTAEPMNDRKVLIVEDNADVSEMLQSELGRYFETETAVDGVEALEILNNAEEKPDLIVSDVMMPRMNGFELTRKVRADRDLRHLPIILLTALNTEEKQEKGLSEGADAYIGKPFSMKVLIAQCSTLIQQRDVLKTSYAKEILPKASLPEVIRDEKDKKFVMQFDALIASQMKDTTLSVDLMAEKLGMGRTTFHNKVRSLTGCTPNDYLRDKRLERAAELLKSGNLTVSEVSYQTGFSSPQYFATNFKKKYGLSPSDY